MPIQYRVAVLRRYLNVYCHTNYTDHPFDCDEGIFQMGLLYLRCLNMSTDYEPIYVDNSYEPDNRMDVFPFPFVINERYYNNSNHVTTPYLISDYKFFSAKRFDHDSILSDELDWSFLIDTFTSQTWLAVVAILIFVKLINEISIVTLKNFSNLEPSSLTSFHMMRLLSSVFMAFMLGLYSANLKASVTLNVRPLAPYKNIEELTRLVKTGKRTLVNESFNTTYVWKVLSGQMLINGVYPDTLRQLYEATEKNPSIEIPRIGDICRRLKIDNQLVFVGRLTDLDEYCPDDCFWSVDIPEVPVVFRSFIFSNETSDDVKEMSNLCVTFLQNVRQRLIQRRRNFYVKNCDLILHNHRINMYTFLGPIWIWLSGIVLGAAAFSFERGLRRVYYRKMSGVIAITE